MSLRDGSHALDHQLRDLSAVGQEHRKRLRCRSQLDVQHPGVADIPPPGSVFHLLRSVALSCLCCCLATDLCWKPSIDLSGWTRKRPGIINFAPLIRFLIDDYGVVVGIYNTGCFGRKTEMAEDRKSPESWDCLSPASSVYKGRNMEGSLLCPQALLLLRLFLLMNEIKNVCL